MNNIKKVRKLNYETEKIMRVITDEEMVVLGDRIVSFLVDNGYDDGELCPYMNQMLHKAGVYK